MVCIRRVDIVKIVSIGMVGSGKSFWIKPRVKTMGTNIIKAQIAKITTNFVTKLERSPAVNGITAVPTNKISQLGKMFAIVIRFFQINDLIKYTMMTTCKTAATTQIEWITHSFTW